ncbi:leucyl-tRNA synthetase [Candidatus Carsonella ruddii HT isolate Thao2000]|uniref:leucine--tRNA ligase n=1 Tax=Candidatus Carsonella ruddii HT isolate Thao2000 TaxID=1202539 RepID=J3VQB7_CARRU|nr:class I tRNA ligase family protein [Candidatus Carsonella ruddii]AFP84146.1 leucyl-tRNA synthetase [Candidatus Carsonella ruddii HT isolate Thao2000]
MKYFKNPYFIEKKIKKNIFNKKNKNKNFILPMFPYPSGKLHLGHFRNYVISDIISRIKYLEQKNVLHSIAWDSFGLPAENASKKNNLSPLKWTISNIKLMRNQIKFLSININKKFEFLTCDFNFYKWEFYLLILFLKNNILYKNIEKVFWDKEEKCILSNEQINNNICWRSGITPEKKKIFTWFINIKKYTKRLIFNLKKTKWSNKIKKIQKKWINVNLFFLKKIKKLYLNYNKNFLNLKSINYILNNNVLFLKINNVFKKIFKLKIFFFNKTKKINEKIFLTNFDLSNVFFLKKNINLYINKKKFFFIKNSNLKNWSFERYRMWGSPFFFKKNNNKKFKSKSTIDTFFQSSWYYLNYLKTKNINNIKKNEWLPIKYYIGGEEHANLHLIYLRVINLIFYDFNILNNKEIIFNLINQGFILNEVYYKIIKKKIFFCKKNNKSYYLGIEKMSKSKKNGINPISIIKNKGSDILRLLIITQKPINKTIIWNEINFNNCKNFIIKINNLIFLKNKNKKQIFNIKKFLNIKKIHNILSNINKILLINNSIKQLEEIIYWIYPIIPNISKIFWFKIGNYYPIEKFLFKNNFFFKFNLFYKKKFLKKIKKINLKNLKFTFLYINKIIISMDEISILLN